MAAPSEHRGLTWAVWLAAGLLVLLLGVAVLAGRPTSGVLTGTSVEGVDVGGASESELRDVVADLAERRREQAVEVEAALDGRTADRETVGELVDTRSTVAEAWNRGRGLFGGMGARLRARFGTTVDLALEARVEEQVARDWARRTAEALSTAPQDGDVALLPDPQPRVEVVEAVAGEVVDGEDLGDRLVDALASQGGAVVLDAPSEPQQPTIGEADVAAARAQAERVISGPVALENPTGGADLRLAPEELAALLGVRRDEAAPAGDRLSIAVGIALAEVVGADALAATEAEAVEATFAIDGEQVAIEGGTSGFALDVEQATARIRDLAVSEGPRTGALPGEELAPDRTRAQAEALGIREQVATFTTSYPCCQPRVTNIQRMAALVDGAIIPAGGSFSLNGHVGERTEAKGFVPGGVIQDGQFEEAIGGGISQFATTFFNTAFFAGIELAAFQPHSFYIERYPMGRESTIAFGLIDVVVANDSPHAILVAAAGGETDVTVTFYSTGWAQVEAFTSPPYDRVEGDVRDGFTVDFGRTVTYPDGRTEAEEWTHIYQPEDDDEDDEDQDDEDDEDQDDEDEDEDEQPDGDGGDDG